MTVAPGPSSILRDGLLGGMGAEALASRYGTPLFVTDLDVVDGQVAALRGVMPDAFDLAFAVKANPLLAVLQHLRGRGLGADVASGGELRHALRAGFDPSTIVMAGPGKRDEELAAAVDAGIRVVTVESRGELRRLASLAQAAGRVQPVLLRLATATPSGAEGVRIIDDEGAGKFGMDLADVRSAAAEAVASPWLEPLGLHAFGASNVLDAAIIGRHVRETVETAARIASEAGFELRLVDVGGGLGVPYGDEAALDLAALGAQLAGAAAALVGDRQTAGARVLLEPGRFLVATSGAYVARVVDRKRVGTAEVAVLDGGIHHLIRPALLGQSHRVVALTGAAATGATEGGTVTLVGPLCTALDILARDVPLGALAAGDLVAVLDAGAYGASESMPFFLSHPLAPEVVMRGGRDHLARPRMDPEAWLSWQADLPAR